MCLKPKPLPKSPDGNCSFVDQMNAICYTSFTECTKDGVPYFMATPCTSYTGSLGEISQLSPQVLGKRQKYAQANCLALVGKHACWPQEPPIYVSDGGPNDSIRTQRAQEQVQAQIDNLLPQLHYHPLLLPKSRDTDIDP